MALDVLDEALEGGQACRTSHQAAVQADGEHLRCLCTLGIQDVEGVLEVVEEVIALVETLHLGEAHVVGVQGVGDHQVRLAGGVVGFPVGQVVVVGIAVVEEAAFLHHQAPGVRAGAPGVPAQGPFAGDLGEDANRFEHVLAFLGLIHVLVVDPAVAVAADFVAGLDHGADHVRMALGGHGHGEDGQRDIEFLEQLEDPPGAGTAAIFVQRFHAHVALALQGLSGDHFREEGFGLLVAMKDVALAAFFVIEHEGQGDAGIAWPVRVGRVGAVTDQVARVVSAHCSLPYCSW